MMIRDTSLQDKVLVPEPGVRNQRRTRWVVAAIVLVLVAYFLFSLRNGSDRSVNASRLQIVPVTRGTLIRDASVNGRVVAAVSPTLYSSSAATVNLKVAAGDKVKKGDVVAVLESPDITDQLKREQSTYEQLQAEVARQNILAKKQKLLAQRDADQAEIERAAAERTLQRIENAGQIGVVAKIDYLKAQDALHSAQIRSKHASQAAELEKDDVDLELKTKISQLQRQKVTVANAQRHVDELNVRAPVDGVVGTLSVANRSVVAANTALMTLVDLSRLEVEVEVPENYVADLGLGMNAEIDIGGTKATGKLVAIAPEVVKNQVLARLRFDGQQPQGLRQSQRVSARLLIDEKPNVLMAARGPFLETEGGRFAYVVKDGIAVRTPVKIGATSVSAVEFLDGVSVGDKVVISGTDAFANAPRVKINY